MSTKYLLLNKTNKFIYDYCKVTCVHSHTREWRRENMTRRISNYGSREYRTHVDIINKTIGRILFIEGLCVIAITIYAGYHGWLRSDDIAILGIVVLICTGIYGITEGLKLIKAAKSRISSR
jgi:hypothetical protein